MIMKNMETTQLPFVDYLFKDKRNKTILWIAAIAAVIQLIIFKYLYPYPSFIHEDSFSYINSAYANYDINRYPIGYSRILRLFSVFTTSDTALVIFQYMLIQCSALYFLFTIFYFYKPGKLVQMVLLGFMVLNPLFLHLANLISSDGLFLALSLIWFTLLLWILQRPTIQLIIWHAIILVIAFTVRYNAIIYPFIAVVAFGFAPLSLRNKISGIAAGIMLCGLFILYTGSKYKTLTGTWQFSPFSGWLKANNAMYPYRNIDNANHKPVPAKFQALDNAVRLYFDTTSYKNYWMEDIPSTFYMWDLRLPFMTFMEQQFQKDTTAGRLKKWAAMGPLYGEYGTYIIKQYPLQYTQYFLWPNAKKYYSPPVEFLGQYNGDKDTVLNIAKVWFGYKSQKVTLRLKDRNVNILNFYPILSGTMNFMFLSCFICFIILNGFKSADPFRKCILLTATIWVLNAGFTILVSPAALRFQAFPILLVTTFPMLIVDWMIQFMARLRLHEETLKPDSKQETLKDQLSL
jgi:hypothetical protein